MKSFKTKVMLTFLIGASLSEHDCIAHACVSMLACLDRPLTVNFK